MQSWECRKMSKWIWERPLFWNSMVWIWATVPKKPLSMSLRSAFFFCLKTCDTISGRSVAVWPGKRLWMISGHLGLAVMVRKRSGLWKCLQMAIASWNSWVINLGPLTWEERRMSLCPKGPISSPSMPIMHSSILKSLVELRSKSMLICPSPVEFPLLTICPCINHKLLEQLSTIEER